MRFMISGYGNGSRRRDGQAEKKSFRTMRGEIKISEASFVFQKDGIISNSVLHPCIKLTGRTIKRNNDATNNELSLLFYELNAEDALEISAKFAEYALFLQSQKNYKKISLEESSNFVRHATSVVTAIINYHPIHLIQPILKGILFAFQNYKIAVERKKDLFGPSKVGAIVNTDNIYQTYVKESEFCKCVEISVKNSLSNIILNEENGPSEKNIFRFTK